MAINADPNFAILLQQTATALDGSGAASRVTDRSSRLAHS